MRFKILPSVSSLRANGVRYKPGDLVDLPDTYLGERWLEPVRDPPKHAEPTTEKPGESSSPEIGTFENELNTEDALVEKPKRRRRDA